METFLLCLAILSGSFSGVAKISKANISTVCSNTKYIIEAGDKYDIDPTVLAALIWVESRWQKNAISSAKACGLTQVLPKYSSKNCRQLRDPKTSIYTGAYFLNKWQKKRKKSLKEALACYNVGNKCLKAKRGISYANLVLRKAKWYNKEIKSYKSKKPNSAIWRNLCHATNGKEDP